MPIVGSFAGASARAYGLGAGGALPGDFESIQTITAGSAVASVEFTSIPATYTHLQIRGIWQSNYTYAVDDGYIYFNADTGTTNYRSHFVQGSGSAASSGDNATRLQIAFGTVGTTAGNQSTASWGSFVLDILDYANTNKYKTVRNISGNDANGTGLGSIGGRVELVSGHWRNTNAITSIKLDVSQGSRNIQQYSSFALYGVKA